MSVIPKQFVQNKVTEASNAAAELTADVNIAIEERAAAEGSTLNVQIGTEKDGFKSITMSTKKGTATEGPSAAIVTENAAGNTTKTEITTNSELTAITGRSSVNGTVIKETTVQANVKGMTAALKDTFSVRKEDIAKNLSTASPIPSKAAAAIDSQVNNSSPAKKVAQRATVVSQKVSREIDNPFGSNNKFGGIGGGFSNIIASIIGVATGTGSFQIPGTEKLAAATSTVLTEKNVSVPTPNLINTNNTTNLTNTVTKSSSTNSSIKTSKKEFVVGENDANWNGVMTRLHLIEGGTWKFPLYSSPDQVEAVMRSCTRKITNLLVYPTNNKVKASFFMNDFHLQERKKKIAKYGAEKINADPKRYVFPCHFLVNQLGAIQGGMPINEEELLAEQQDQPAPYNETEAYNDLQHIFSTSVILRIDYHHIKNPKDWIMDDGIEDVIGTFLKVWPGAEVISIDQLLGRSNTLGFDLQELVLSKFNKASVFSKGEQVKSIPSQGSLADQTPKNVTVVPKPKHDTTPNINKTVKTATAPAPTNFNSSAANIGFINDKNSVLDNIKQKQDGVLGALLKTGSGLLGTDLTKLQKFDQLATNNITKSLTTKVDGLQQNLSFDSIKNKFTGRLK